MMIKARRWEELETWKAGEDRSSLGEGRRENRERRRGAGCWEARYSRKREREERTISITTFHRYR